MKIMKDYFTTVGKTLLADRSMLTLLGVFLLGSIAYVLYVSLSLRPSDLQLGVRYTAYGETNFYRDQWYYLISFAVFGVMMAAIHTSLALKIYTQDRRQLARLFVVLSIVLLVIAWFVTRSVLNVAFL